MPWSTPLYEPIIFPDSWKLITLKDAANYITGLPKKESNLPEWQTAIEVLLLCSRGGDAMMARHGQEGRLYDVGIESKTCMTS
jgi:hypothetical protein